MKATVDRIEGDVAVLLVRPEEKDQILIPRRYLSYLKEGDIVEITVTREEQATDEARERVSSMIDRLRNRDALKD